MTSPCPLIVGHRGAADIAPENTLKAFRRALVDGADMLECDVHLSADGRDVIIHDATIDRTAQDDSPLRTGTVAELTRDQLDQVLVGDGEHIPTLGEVLEAAQRGDGTRAPVLVEIKAVAAAELAAGILTEFFDEEVWQQQEPPARIISFQAEALRIAGAAAPQIPRGLLCRELSDHALEEATGAGAQMLSVRMSELREGDFPRIRERGIVPNVWAVGTEEEIRAAVDLGAPWMGSDDPARTRRVVDRHLRR